MVLPGLSLPDNASPLDLNLTSWTLILLRDKAWPRPIRHRAGRGGSHSALAACTERLAQQAPGQRTAQRLRPPTLGPISNQTLWAASLL